MAPDGLQYSIILTLRISFRWPHAIERRCSSLSPEIQHRKTRSKTLLLPDVCYLAFLRGFSISNKITLWVIWKIQTAIYVYVIVCVCFVCKANRNVHKHAHTRYAYVLQCLHMYTYIWIYMSFICTMPNWSSVCTHNHVKTQFTIRSIHTWMD